MKYIRTYKIFEGNKMPENIEEIKTICEDILLDIEDDEFHTKILLLRGYSENPPNRYLYKSIKKMEIIISKEKNFNISEISDVKSRLINYLEGEGIILEKNYIGIQDESNAVVYKAGLTYPGGNGKLYGIYRTKLTFIKG
jgi:hypothetical protein